LSNTLPNNSEKATILLIDNGSTRSSATLQLRYLAKTLSNRTGRTIHPVSLKHSDEIPQNEVDNTLAGIPAQVFRQFMTERLEMNERKFILIPLFFGNSRALTSFIPDEKKQLELIFGDFSLKMAEALYPLPNGDPLLVDILHQNALKTSDNSNDPYALKNVVLVDHGSPIPAVNDVRKHIAHSLRKKLPKDVRLDQAAMERRKGKEYDFNGELLSDHLHKLTQSGELEVTVLLLFLLPGSHAGKNGDIAQICDKILEQYPNFKIKISPLVSQNENLIQCLVNRLNAMTETTEI